MPSYSKEQSDLLTEIENLSLRENPVIKRCQEILSAIFHLCVSKRIPYEAVAKQLVIVMESVENEHVVTRKCEKEDHSFVGHAFCTQVFTRAAQYCFATGKHLFPHQVFREVKKALSFEAHIKDDIMVFLTHCIKSIKELREIATSVAYDPVLMEQY